MIKSVFLLIALLPSIALANTASTKEAERLGSNKQKISEELRKGADKCNAISNQRGKVKCHQELRNKYNKSMRKFQEGVIKNHGPNMEPYRQGLK